MKKNVASQVVGAQLNSKTDGSAVTAGTTTCYVTGDGGTQAAGSVGSGACAHEGNGFWTYTPAQAETNYDHVAFTFVNTSAVNATVQVYPGFPQTGDNFTRLGAPALASVSADIAATKALLPTALAADGSVKASVQSFLGTAFTEGAAGRIAAAFKQFFNIAAPAATMDHGILVDTVTTATTATNLTNAPTAGDFTATMKTSLNAATPAVTVSDKTGFSLTTGERTAIANEVEAQIIDETDSEKVLTAITDKIAAVNPDLGGLTVAAIASAVWSATTRVLTAGTNIVLAKGIGVTGFNDLSAAQVNAEADTALADVGVTTTVTGRIDASILSRLASASYTAPDNADIVAILGFVDTEVAAIKAKTDNLPAAPAAVGDIPTASAVAAAVWAFVVEGTTTAVQLMRGFAAVLLSKASGLATTTASYRDVSDTKDRVVATVDADGNRSAVTLDLT